MKKTRKRESIIPRGAPAVSVYLDEPSKAALVEIAKQQKRSMSGLACVVLEKFIANTRGSALAKDSQ